MNNQTNNDYDKNLSWSDDPDDVPSWKEENDGAESVEIDSMENIGTYNTESDNEEDDDKISLGPFIKTGSMMVLALAILIFVSIAWFTMNRDNSATGMGVKVVADKYIITSPDDATNGLYYVDYHSKILENEEQPALVWQVTSGSNINNIDAEGEKAGIGPGSEGVITFYVTPKVDSVDITFNFDTFGYVVSNDSEIESGTQVAGGQESGSNDYSVDEITSSTIKNYLAGHILLFEGYDSQTRKYSGIIPLTNDRKRVLSKTFTGKDVKQRVDIYWIWPKNLSNMIYVEDIGQELICERSSVDYSNLVLYITTFPNYFLQGDWSGITLTEEIIQQSYTTYGGYYDGADNDIGSGVEYILLRLSTDD